MTEKKYFTLLSGLAVHPASDGSKILPEETFGILVSAKELLDRIQQEAEEYRKSVIEECEKLKIHAEQEGFQSGYEKWVEHVAKLEEEIAKVEDDVTKLIIPVASKAAHKIVSKELDSSPEIILGIVKATLKQVSQHKKIVIYVCREDFDVVENNRNDLKDLFESLESLSIRVRDDMEKGDCSIETEYGIINARLKDRWRTLEAALEQLGKSIKKRST